MHRKLKKTQYGTKNLSKGAKSRVGVFADLQNFALRAWHSPCSTLPHPSHPSIHPPTPITVLISIILFAAHDVQHWLCEGKNEQELLPLPTGGDFLLGILMCAALVMATKLGLFRTCTEKAQILESCCF